MSTELKRYTGYRIQLLPDHQQAFARADLHNKCDILTPIIDAALREPYFVDDAYRQVPSKQLLIHALEGGEVFICIHKGNVAGLMALRGILANRHALLEVWAHPEYRASLAGRRILRGFAKDLFKYAFAPFGPNGLGLVKIKAEICVDNAAALKAARAMGFMLVGRSPLDGFYNSQPKDMVLVELFNPEYFNLSEPEIINGQGQQSSTSSASSLRTTAGVSTATATASGSAASVDGRTGNGPRRRGRGEVAELATARAKPRKPRPRKPGRE